MLRSNHYEVAFEAYLRARGVGFVAVDEAKRSVLGDAAVKSLDFIVVGPDTAKLVVDVKGRKFPTGSGEKAVPAWQNWAEEDDVDGLGRWAAQFGGGFRGVLAFVYDIHKPYQLSDGTRDLFAFRDHVYLMRGVAVADYRTHMRLRSKKWRTVHLPTAAFRTVVRPFSEFLRDTDVSDILK